MDRTQNTRARLRLIAPVAILFAVLAPLFGAVPSTSIEAAIDQLRARFPNQIVVGFEELWEPRPEREPVVDLGPSGSSLNEVLARIRRNSPQYRLDLLPGGLVHVYPARATADPPHLLDIRLAEFVLPPDECMAQQFLYIDSPMHYFSYTPELSKYLWQRKENWYHSRGKEPGGILGDFMGDCVPNTHRREPIYRNITVREALNLMAIRSLQVTNKQLPSTAPDYFKPKPISWKYRFRPQPKADTGLGGVPVFQVF